ncbi:cilia- and flagella-associated protein 161 [Manacus vitellinus]|uniref:cilia- and flagella-associated protein 161 n=1 Tax=Manacus vitellinus TaxID=328815 RepID=UPI000846957B|nr:cilia- and flagella-associated protein 161 [Manacus vitellinus]XP_051652662.1 cilia- and flagella-associated protein 161 [Manacus candei]
MAAYGRGVRVGNWLEDLHEQEELLRDFISRRERGQLLMQRLARLQENILKKVKLSVSVDGLVHFGDTVMIMNPDTKTPEAKDDERRGDLTLAVDMEEISLFSDDPPQVSRGLSAVNSVNPVGRNTFCIVSADGSGVGEPLRFGQNFLLGTTGGISDTMFYLGSDHKTFTAFAKKSRLQPVFLTGEDSYLTCWQAAFLDPQLRLEYEGFPVPANTKILITHCYTNRNLAIPRNFCVWSYFGKECEVVCHNYLDSHKVEEYKNYWEIITGNPGAEGGTMIDRPKPHPDGYKNEELP